MTIAPASRSRTLLTSFILILALGVFFSAVLPAHAATFNPGCTGTTGDSAALEAAVVTSRTNGQADTFNLVAGCTYTLTQSLHFLIDGGNAIIFNGNGATLNGNGTVNFIINTDAGSVTTINNLTITNGRTAVLNTSSSLTLTNVTITGNTSANVGGGIINGIDGVFTGTITLNNSTVSNNTATNNGGGIYNAINSTVNLNNSTVRDNDSGQGGGIYTRSGGTVTATNSTISGNDATISGGGGIYNNNGTVTLKSSTVSNNTIPAGPNLGSNLTGNGGSSTYNVNNSIVANPVGSNNCFGIATLNANYSLFEDGSCPIVIEGDNIIGQDPNLGMLTGNPAYYPLNPGSVAINAGNNTLSSGIPIDQAGNARVRGGTVDMGSYEAEIPIIMISPSTANTAEGSSTGLTVSRVGSTSFAQPVTFSIVGSASSADYSLTVGGSPVTNSLTIPAGTANVTLTINVTNDIHAEADEIVVITLNDTNHYDLGSPSASTVTIPANDFGVINGNDSGEGSLRQAATNANNFNTNDTISFSGVTTVTLTSGELGLVNNGTLTINGGGVTVSGNNASRVFSVFGGANVTLNRLTITGGSNGGGLAGGINNDGTLTIIGSTIRNNSALGGGGIANNGGATLTLTNTTMTGNSTSLAGGAILNNGTLTVNNSTFAGNSTGVGGNVVANGTVTINNSILADQTGLNCSGVGAIDINFSVLEGGGCSVTNGVDGNKTGDPGLGSLTGSPAYFPITDTSIAFNAGSNGLVPGGVTTDQPGNTRIRGSVVDIGSFEFQCVTLPYTVPAGNAILLAFAVECANSASSNDVINLTNSTYTLGGALGVANNGTLTINGNGATVSANNASRVFDVASGANVTVNTLTVRDGVAGLGGGINNSGTLTLNRVTVRDNAATGFNGGGIQNNVGATLTLINTTVTGNTAPFNGGGIFNNGAMTITNSTIAGNASGSSGSGVSNNLGTATINNSIIADNVGSVNCASSAATISFSVIEGSGCGVTHGVNGNKILDPGLGTLTGSPAYFPLLAGSIAIDAGSNALAAGIATDQAGNTRIQNATVDIGAFEVTPASLTVTLTMQGRPGGASPTKVVTAHVQIRLPGSTTPISTQDFVSSTNGQITVPNLTPGTYDVWIKGSHTLSVLHNVTFAVGTNSLTTALLLEGDASDDNLITLPDFSILATSFGLQVGEAGYDARADFNQDGRVTIVDFSLLASNFSLSGVP